MIVYSLSFSPETLLDQPHLRCPAFTINSFPRPTRWRWLLHTFLEFCYLKWISKNPPRCTLSCHWPLKCKHRVLDFSLCLQWSPQHPQWSTAGNHLWWGWVQISRDTRLQRCKWNRLILAEVEISHPSIIKFPVSEGRGLGLKCLNALCHQVADQ